MAFASFSRQSIPGPCFQSVLAHEIHNRSFCYIFKFWQCNSSLTPYTTFCADQSNDLNESFLNDSFLKDSFLSDSFHLQLTLVYSVIFTCFFLDVLVKSLKIDFEKTNGHNLKLYLRKFCSNVLIWC